jgi:hypothetical protein
MPAGQGVDPWEGRLLAAAHGLRFARVVAAHSPARSVTRCQN